MPIPKILKVATYQNLADMSEPYPELVFSNKYPTAIDYPDSEIKYMVYHEAPGMAPITARGVKAPIHAGGGVSEISQQGILIQEKIQHSEEDVNKVLELKAASPIKAEAFEKIFLKKGETVIKRIQYRKEHMAAMIGCNAGEFDYIDDHGNQFTIDYNLPASHMVALTGTDVWATGSTRTPLEDVYDMKEKIETDSGGIVTDIYSNSKTFRNMISTDANLLTMIENQKHNQGFNAMSQPWEAFGALFDAPFRKYDAKQPIYARLTTTIDTKVFTVDSAIGLTAGDTVKLCKGLNEVAVVEEEEVIDSISGNTITLVAQPAATFIPGRDSIKANVPFLPDNRLVFWVETVQGEPLLQWYNAPMGNPTGYGMRAKTWMTDELEDVFQRIQLLGTWALSNNQAIGILDVA